MSRLASYSVPVPPPHSLSAAPDILFLVTEHSRSPLLVFGTDFQILSLPQLPEQFAGPGFKITCLTFLTLSRVTVQ